MSDYTIPVNGIKFPPPPDGLRWCASLHPSGSVRIALNSSEREEYWHLAAPAEFRDGSDEVLSFVLADYENRKEQDAQRAAFGQALRDAAEKANRAAVSP